MIKNLNSVTLSLDEYNELRDTYNEVLIENNELENTIQELQKNPEQKVIVKEVETDEEFITTHYHLKGFEDVKEDVEKIFGKRIGELEEENKKLRNECSDLKNLILDKDIKYVALKERTLWQRILNK